MKFVLLLLPLCHAADPSTHSAKLQYYDSLAGDEPALQREIAAEIKTFQTLANQELEYLSGHGVTMMNNLHACGLWLEAKEENLLLPVLRLYAALHFISQVALRAAANILSLVSMGTERAYVMATIDQALQVIKDFHPFFIELVFIGDGGKLDGRFSWCKLFDMAERHNDPRTWIRIIFALLDESPKASQPAFMVTSASQATKKKAKKNKNKVKGNLRTVEVSRETRNFMFNRMRITEALLTPLLRLQYLAVIIFGRVIIDESCMKLEVIINLASSWAQAHAHRVFPPNQSKAQTGLQDSFRVAVQLVSGSISYADSSSPQKFVPISSLIGFFEAQSDFEGDSVLVRFICSQARYIIPVFPLAARAIDSMCTKPYDEDENEQKKDGGKNKKPTKGNTKSVEEQVNLAYDSDEGEEEDEVSKVTSMVDGLRMEATPENWKPSEAWLTAAKVFMAQYCRITMLIPLREKLYPEGVPDNFTWSMLLEAGGPHDEELKFCVGVTLDRNFILKGDGIFKFLPEFNVASQSLASHGIGHDSKALSFLMKFVPGERYQEAPSPTSLLLPDKMVRFNLLILGLHPACLRVEDAELEIAKVATLCRQIKRLRNSIAHPKYSEPWIKLLGKELKQFVAY